MGERVGGVGVQALEPARVGAAGDPELERGAVVPPGLPGRELPAEAPLLVGGALEVGGQLGIALELRAPALDAARRLQPRDRGHELRAGEVVRGRERVARVVVRRLLRDRGRAEGAARRYAKERARRAAELSLDERAVIHPAADA